jgi:hypothetical protein
MTLFDAVMKKQVFLDKNLSAAVRNAADVFIRMQIFELTENERAKSDPVWASLMDKIRTKDPRAYPIRDNLIPLLDSMVLTKSDVDKDELWRTAPVVVCGNLHRTGLIRTMAPIIASKLKAPVICWHLPLTGNVGESLSVEQAEELYAQDPRLTAVVIPGYTGYLNKSLNPDRVASNGTPFLYHSVTLDERSESFVLDRAALAADVAPGNIIFSGISTPIGQRGVN